MSSASSLRGLHAADGDRPARHDDAQLREERLGQRSGRRSRRGFPRAGALQDVACVVRPELQRTGEIGVAGPRPGDGARLSPRGRTP